MNFLEQKALADAHDLNYLVQAHQQGHPLIRPFILQAAISDKLEQRQRYQALEAQSRGEADPQTTAVDRQMEEAQRMLLEQGGIAGVDPGMDQELLPEEMAALQSGIVGAPPMDMEPQPQQMLQDLMLQGQMPQGQMPQGQMPQDLMLQDLMPQDLSRTPDMMAAGGGLIPGYQKGRIVGGPDPDILGYSPTDLLERYQDYLSDLEPIDLDEIIGDPGGLAVLGGPLTRGAGFLRGIASLRNPAGRATAREALRNLFRRKADVLPSPALREGMRGRTGFQSTLQPTQPPGTALVPFRGRVGPDPLSIPTPGRFRRGLDLLARNRGKTILAGTGLAGTGLLGLGMSPEGEPLLDEEGEIVPSELRWDPESWIGGGDPWFGEESQSGLEFLLRKAAQGGMWTAGLYPQSVAGLASGIDKFLPTDIFPFEERWGQQAAEEGWQSLFPFLPSLERVPTVDAEAASETRIQEIANALNTAMGQAREREDVPGLDPELDTIDALIDKLRTDIQTQTDEEIEYNNTRERLAAAQLERAKVLQDKGQEYIGELRGRKRSPERLAQERRGQVMLNMGLGMMEDPRKFPEVMRETSEGLRSLDTRREQEGYALQDLIANADMNTLREWMQAQDVSDDVKIQIMGEAAQRARTGQLELGSMEIQAEQDRIAREHELRTLRIQETGAMQRAELGIRAQAPQLFEALNQAINTIGYEHEDPEMIAELRNNLYNTINDYLQFAGTDQVSALVGLSGDDWLEIIDGLEFPASATEEEISEGISRVIEMEGG